MNTPLQEWINTHPIGSEMIWKSAASEQFYFVRDVLFYLLVRDLDYEDFIEDRPSMMTVISTHTSKSILLPVYKLTRPEIGLTLILRYNFYNWKLSVISERPIEADFDALFHTTPPLEPDYTGDNLHPVYFEGFPEELIFPYYSLTDKKKWSAQIGGKYALWTTVFLIMKSLGRMQPAQWNTRESHRKELDEASRKREARRLRELEREKQNG